MLQLHGRGWQLMLNVTRVTRQEWKALWHATAVARPQSPKHCMDCTDIIPERLLIGADMPSGFRYDLCPNRGERFQFVLRDNRTIRRRAPQQAPTHASTQNKLAQWSDYSRWTTSTSQEVVQNDNCNTQKRSGHRQAHFPHASRRGVHCSNASVCFTGTLRPSLAGPSSQPQLLEPSQL